MLKLTADDVFLNAESVSRIKIEKESLIILSDLTPYGEPQDIEFNLSLENNNAVMQAKTHFGIDFFNKREVDSEELKTVLLDCVNSNTKLEDTVFYTMTKNRMLKEIVKVVEEKMEALLFREKEFRHFSNGLGTLKYKGEIIGFFEGFSLTSIDYEGYVQIHTYLPSSPLYELNEDMILLEAKYYDFEENRHYIFNMHRDEATAPTYEFEFLEIDDFKVEHEEVAPIYKAYQTPYAEKESGLESPKHIEYINSRMEIIKIKQENQRKENVASRFAGLNF